MNSQKIIENVKINGGCWEWQLKPDSDGYGRIKIEGKNILVHRAFYNIFLGEIPPGLELDHLCRNKICVNPSHLEAVTHKINTLRSFNLCAVYARRTYCPKGHPLSGDNLRIDTQNARVCRICEKEYNRSYRFGKN